MGSLFEMKLRSAESNGGAAAMLVTQPPGVATPQHVHEREAEIAFVLEGTMTYRAGDEVFHLEAGSFLYLPKGVPHAFRITGDVAARWLGITLPGGLEHLYDEVGRPADERRLPGGPMPDPDEIMRWVECAPRYGLRVVGPPVPEDA